MPGDAGSCAENEMVNGARQGAFCRGARQARPAIRKIVANRIPGRRATCRSPLQISILEPIQEVRIHEQRDGLVKRRSMRRIMARRMKAATVRA